MAFLEKVKDRQDYLLDAGKDDDGFLAFKEGTEIEMDARPSNQHIIEYIIELATKKFPNFKVGICKYLTPELRGKLIEQLLEQFQ